MRQLVLNNLSYTLLCGSTAGLLVEEEVDRAVCNQTPVPGEELVSCLQKVTPKLTP